ncbi:MAG: diguanylate cyclase [Betaproteobacteria bacterium]
MPTPRRQMPRRIYPLRILGMGLGGMVVGVVLWERHASVSAWLAMVLPAFVWPHVAYLITRHSADPYRAETRNLLIDSALAASFVPLMHFNLLPSVLLLTLTMVDKITTGIRGLWARALPAMLVGGLAGAALAGLHWAPETSMRVMVACLPVMALHTLSVSMVSYQLIRQSARHNQMLDELRRVDALTGLFGRGHWQEQAEAALRRHHASNEPACMLMLDIDHFKEINDAHGHTVGDEVIRALAHVVRGNVRAGDCAGRYGGDEFAIVLPGMLAKDALAIAHRIREQTEGVRLRSLPGVRITSSIGVAPADHRHSNLRAWIDAADAALYVAKNGGRNRVAGSIEPALAPAV